MSTETTRPRLTTRLAGFGTTIFTEMTRLANEHGAINLAQGFPDFDGPDFIKQAAQAAMNRGANQYARMTGTVELCRALSQKYQRDYGLTYREADEVVVTAGCTEAIFCAINALCDAGDEVILFEPFYDSYIASVKMAGAVPRFVTLHGPDWRLDLGELERAFTKKTRLLMLNTPHNPTGKVFSRAELEAIAKLCIAHDVVVLSDEVYEHLVYDGSHTPMATIPGMFERTVTLSSLGKTFSLTGWKIGWACAPKELTAAIRTAHQFVTFAVATPLQHGAAAALSTDRAFYTQLTSEYRQRRDHLTAGLERAGLRVRKADGTYFVCADVPAGFADDVAFCKHLIEKVGVAAIPPSAFYGQSDEGKAYVRFAFCKKPETLDAAIERLQKLRG
jgi:N-succinyldiaminopimelate aminotransferase